MDNPNTIPEELRKRYLSRRQKDLDSLVEARACNNFETFRKVGHQLQGNAPTFGYEDLAKLGILFATAGKT